VRGPVLITEVSVITPHSASVFEINDLSEEAR
jgi:hypothetical protein